MLALQPRNMLNMLAASNPMAYGLLKHDALPSPLASSSTPVSSPQQ